MRADRLAHRGNRWIILVVAIGLLAAGVANLLLGTAISIAIGALDLAVFVFYAVWFYARTKNRRDER